MEDQARAAGGNVSMESGRRVRDKRHAGRSVRAGLLTLFGVVALAGCGDDNETVAGEKKGDAEKVEAKKSKSKSKSKLKTIDRQKASGEFATAQAAGTAKRPRRILMSIKATPPQKVQASWSLTCLKGEKAGTKDGIRVVETPIAMTLKQPMKGNESCVVAATGQLVKKGEVIVKLASTSR